MYDIRLDWSADVRRCNTRLDDTARVEAEEEEEVQRTLNETIQVN